MSQEIVIRITIPDGVGIVTPEVTQGSFVPPFADELIPLPPEAIPVQGDPTAFRGMARVPEVAQVQSGFAEGMVHASGHSPLKRNKRGLFCPTKLPNGAWCQFTA